MSGYRPSAAPREPLKSAFQNLIQRLARGGGASLLAHLALPMLPRILAPEPRPLGAVGELLNLLSSRHDAHLADGSLDSALQYKKTLASRASRYMYAAMQQE